MGYNLPDKRRLSSNLERGTNSVSCCRLPVQPVRCLCALTQGRLQERIEQAGHLYLKSVVLHSSHNLEEDDDSMFGGFVVHSTTTMER